MKESEEERDVEEMRMKNKMMKVVKNFSFENLNKNLCVMIGMYLDIESLGRMSCVNKHWNEKLQNPTVKNKINYFLEK